MAGLYAPLPTLRRRPRGRLRTARGRCGSLLLHRSGLAPQTPCRSPGALTRIAARTLAPSPICDQLHRRLQPFRHLHDCSGCFRLERSPGGTCTHWKAPPSHGARKQQTFATVSQTPVVAVEEAVARHWPRRHPARHSPRPSRGESHSRPSWRGDHSDGIRDIVRRLITNPVSFVPFLVSHRFVKLWPLPMQAKLR